MREENGRRIQTEVPGRAGASARLDKEVRFLLSVPRAVLIEREKQYRDSVTQNPKRRGPKRKVKLSASPPTLPFR